VALPDEKGERRKRRRKEDPALFDDVSLKKEEEG